LKNTRICFLGCGNMGNSLIGGLLADGCNKEFLCGADPNATQRNKLKDRYDIEVYESNAEALAGAKVVVLAVKPQVMQVTLTDIAATLGSSPALIISIAAGIRIASISRWLGTDLPIIRAMPNTPALIRAGVTALYGNKMVTNEQRELAETIMRSVGSVLWVDEESSMDAVTALSGSGPAYFFLLMEVLEKAALELKLPSDKARLLILETALGAAKMAVESEFDAAALRRQVTSPGGTTEQALEVLTRGNLENLFLQAVTAARNRSIELAETFGGKG
jgi:pyrroline-5-carboxylate reductase